MSHSGDPDKPLKMVAAPLNKPSKASEPIDFLATPSKPPRKPMTTPSNRSNNNPGTGSSSFTSRASVQRTNLIDRDIYSSPISSSSKPVPIISAIAGAIKPLSSPSAAGIYPTTVSECTSNFLNRAEPFKTSSTLNENLPLPTQPVSSSRQVSHPIELSVLTPSEKFRYRYMYEKITDRSDVLDRQLEYAASILAEWYDIEEWHDPSLMSQDDIWAVGRICSESQDSRVTEQACWLETSRTGGRGRRVWLQWEKEVSIHGVGSGEAGIGLFPGSFVGLRGRNGSGNYFSVQEILSMPLVEPPMSLPSELIRMHPSTTMNPISMAVACGPFTWDEDMKFLPFAAMVDRLTIEKPDIVILLGPFIDINHPLIKAGDLDQMPSTIFREKIMNRLQKMMDCSPNMKIVLIPSPRDLLSSHPVFPQAGFDPQNSELGIPSKGFYCLPNPVMITINETVIGISNVEVLMPLRKEEYFKSGQVVVTEEEVDDTSDPNAKDIISRTCRHVMRQRSFYPIFPPVISKGIDSINLDVTHLDLIKYDPVGADILIMPSNLAAFSKIIGSSIVVNPRRLCQSKSTGTYVKLNIYPFEEKSIESMIKFKSEQEDYDDEQEAIEHFIPKRCRVDIIKI